MRICPTCKTAYPRHGQSTCPRDGSPLVDAAAFAAERADPLIGATLSGRFQIAARIGTGGMGTVYRAHQAGLSRQVALKVLKPELVQERETVARFQREAKAMSMLLHQHTVRVFDFGEDPATGHLYLAMELLEGELLSARLALGGSLDVVEAITFIRAVLGSLGEAHSKGIVHRDLKPDNIYLARIEGQAQPVVKVLDFGIAKVWRADEKIDQLETQAGTVFGTPRYMSPEQAQGKPLDPRSDLYSVGVLLYHLLTGRAPFVDDDAVVVMAKHIRERPEAPRQAAPDRPIPASLERVVLKAMEKVPAHRFASAEDFDRALDACIGDAVAEKSLTETERRVAAVPTIAGLPRTPVLIGVGMLALALVVAGATIASTFSDPPQVTGPATPTPAAPTEPAPPSPTTRHVVVDSEPPGAELWRDGVRVGTTPQPFDLAPNESGTLELRLDGHDTATLELAGAAPQQTVTLVPRRQAEASPSRRATPEGDTAARPSAPAVEPREASPAPVVAPAPAAAPREAYERFE